MLCDKWHQCLTFSSNFKILDNDRLGDISNHDAVATRFERRQSNAWYDNVVLYEVHMYNVYINGIYIKHFSLGKYSIRENREQCYFVVYGCNMCLRCTVWACGSLINPQSFCLYLMHGVWKKVFRKAFQYICFKVFKYSDCIQVAECISIQCITAVQLFRYSIYYNVFQYCPALPVAYDILWTRRANMSLISARDFWASVHPFLHLSLTIINSVCGLQPEGGGG